ncbi:MAG: C40 family peptidase [Thermoleophilia bacterium]|nr:C40 family peptidase [Thermoleophilia bacterium]
MRAAGVIAAVTCALLVATVAAQGAALPTAVPGSSSPAEFQRGGGAVAAAGTARASRPVKAVGPFAWSSPSLIWSRDSGVLPAALVAKGPLQRMTRAQFLVAVVKLEALRAAQQGTPTVLASAAPGAAWPDAAPGTLGSRALALGWLTPQAGRFAPFAPITSNEAALLMTGVLGLRPSTADLAARLKTTFPEVRVAFTYAAAQALVRTVGLRYNVLDPFDQYELGPTEAVNLAHGSYMLATAGRGLGSWKLDEARTLASTWAVPTLGPNQRTILGAAISQLGQPYVWAGESEGKQAEGHGGFDCSGFAIRVINSSGVPATSIASLNERTTYTQSAIPAPQRIGLAQLQPGDAIYFGSRGTKSTPTENYHAGVYMGNGWFIHSSGGNGGVAINRLDGWWGTQYSWGRRALLTP